MPIEYRILSVLLCLLILSTACATQWRQVEKDELLTPHFGEEVRIDMPDGERIEGNLACIEPDTICVAMDTVVVRVARAQASLYVPNKPQINKRMHPVGIIFTVAATGLTLFLIALSIALSDGLD
jgi:hypothetical protein